jgi:hypothetical protein
MRGQMAVVAVVLGLAFASGSSCAMNTPKRTVAHCQVIGGERLPVVSGDVEVLCAAIEQAVSAEAPGIAYTVEVRVLPRSMVAATVTTADGRQLPEQRFAVMDGELTRVSFERFAKAIAGALKATPR